MDDEKLAVQLNLSDFESIFELRTNEMSEEVRLKKEAGKISYSLVNRLLARRAPRRPGTPLNEKLDAQNSEGKDNCLGI